MSEPEDVVIDAAEVAAQTAVGLWRRRGAERDPEVIELEAIQRRLDLFLKATVGVDAPLVVAEPPRPPNVVVRWLRGTPDFLVRRRPLPSTDGVRIRLPRRLPVEGAAQGREEARYRLWAVEQALRIRRGTAEYVPDGGSVLARALYRIAEAAAVDRDLVRLCPGLVEDLFAERGRALERRPERAEMTGPEQWVEGRLREVLGADPSDPPGPFGDLEAPARSRGWAEQRAGPLADRSDEYRGIPPVDLWGEVRREAGGSGGTSRTTGTDDPADDRRRTQTVERRPRARVSEEDEDERSDGWFVPSDDLHETAQDPMGLNRPVDRDDEVDPEELAESLAEMQQGRLVQTDEPAREVLASEDPPPRSMASIREGEVEGIVYPEWDCRQREYLPERVTVRSTTVEPGGGRWADRMVREKGRLIRDVRRCFEHLQPRRRRLRRQPDGPELDVGAYVEAYGDRRAGAAPEDRLYRKIRPGRREVAVELLVDVSASTDSWVRGDRRVIDIEKEALLVVCEALDALGDRYGVTTFSGRGPEAVRVRTVKGFDEEYDETVRRRIGQLAPDRYTRCGAALRHATATVRERDVRHPVVLLISDGKPNDVDVYEGQYGIEDTRQAVHEAQMQGVEVFCLTVDREAPTYMEEIFGPDAYAVLHQPDLLPRVLVQLVRRLLDR